MVPPPRPSSFNFHAGLTQSRLCLVELPDCSLLSVRPELPVVQFAARTFYATEGSRFEATVMRLGDSSMQCEVDWSTLPGPYEGKKFLAGQGKLVFAPGVSFNTFEVEILSDDRFDSTLQFGIALSNPHDCHLGLYLKVAIVKILDDDTFPSNVYKERLLADPTTLSWQRDTSSKMLKHWVKFTYRATPNSKRILVVDQIDNLIFIWDLCIFRAIVNLLSSDDEWHILEFLDPGIAILFYALCLLLPNAISHWFSYRKTTWKVTDGARKVLQENLLRKYFYQDESTAFASPTVFLETFGHDVGDLVTDGYNKVFVVAKSFGELILSFGVTIFFAIEAKIAKDLNVVFLAALPFVVQPVACYIIIWLRWRPNRELRRKLQSQNDALLYKTDKAIEYHRLVADYWCRALVVDDCTQDIKLVNATMATLAGAMANNCAFVEWVNEILKLIWILVGGFAVAENYLSEQGGVRFGVSLGTFVAVFSLIKSNGQQFESIFNEYMTISATYPALWRIVKLMNLPSDSERRRQTLQFRLQKTRDSLEMAKADHPDAFFPMDEVKLVVDNVAFSYDKSHLDYQFKNFSCSIKQGTAVCIAGGHGVGKSTLLKVIGDVLPQSHGTVFIPSHLRVLHVSAEFILWPGTVAENLFFGECAMHNLMTDQYHTLNEHAGAGCLERGWKICKKLQFPSNLQREAEDLDSTAEVESLHLTQSQKQLIHLARALIVNPEVLVIHQPSLVLGKDRSHVVGLALKSYVQQRGLEMDPATQNLRRPRTLIFSSYDSYTATFANDRFQMDDRENYSEPVLTF